MVHHEKLVYVEDIEVTAQKYREYLLPKIKKVPGPLGTECWLIPETLTPNVKFWAASTACVAFIGPVEGSPFIYRKCNRVNCVNPDHLVKR
jgi:hypothetical protein